MAWTTPKEFVSGERLFASDLNTYVSDNLSDLDTRVEAIPDAPTALQFDTVITITATDATWTVPTLADPVVKVTVVGAGGGGGGAFSGNASAGGASSFACTAGTATAAGGYGGRSFGSRALSAGQAPHDGASGAPGGGAGYYRNPPTYNGASPEDGGPGALTVAYFDLTSVTTANVTVGAGGAGGVDSPYNGAAGGDGVVIFEYRAG